MMTTRPVRELGWAALCGLLVTACFSDPTGDETTTSAGTSGDEAVTTTGLDASTGEDVMTSSSGSTSGSDEGSSSGSDTGGGEDTGTTTDRVDGEAQVRVIHGSPGAGAVDIYAAGSPTPLVSDIDYTGVSDWITVPEGNATIEVRSAGAPASEEPLFVAETLTIDDGARLSIIAAGIVGADDPEAQFRLLPVEEDWGNDLAGRARGRVVHAGADAPPVTIEGLEGESIGLLRYDDSESAGVPLDIEGGERLEVSVADDLITSFTTPAFAEGDQVLIVATGLLGTLARDPEGFALIAVGRDGPLGVVRQDPQLFTLHGSRDANSLDMCANGEIAAVNFMYGEIQSTRLSPGEYDLTIFDYPSGCTNPDGPLNGAGGNTSGELEPGERYLMLLSGERNAEDGEPSIQVVPFTDQFTTGEDDFANIRFVHGASAQQIYVGSVLNETIAAANVYTQPIEWRAESVETSLTQGLFVLGVADAVGKPAPPLNPLVTFNYTADGGSRQWGIISGDPSPEEGDGFVQLMLIETSTPQWTVDLVDINPQ